MFPVAVRGCRAAQILKHPFDGDIRVKEETVLGVLVALFLRPVLAVDEDLGPNAGWVPC